MLCPKCGKEVLEKAEFCQHCCIRVRGTPKIDANSPLMAATLAGINPKAVAKGGGAICPRCGVVTYMAQKHHADADWLKLLIAIALLCMGIFGGFRNKKKRKMEYTCFNCGFKWSR